LKGEEKKFIDRKLLLGFSFFPSFCGGGGIELLLN
jgi:hypothetical protein